jgi:hypothetical protein
VPDLDHAHGVAKTSPFRESFLTDLDVPSTLLARADEVIE